MNILFSICRIRSTFVPVGCATRPHTCPILTRLRFVSVCGQCEPFSIFSAARVGSVCASFPFEREISSENLCVLCMHSMICICSSLLVLRSSSSARCDSHARWLFRILLDMLRLSGTRRRPCLMAVLPGQLDPRGGWAHIIDACTQPRSLLPQKMRDTAWRRHKPDDSPS